MIFADIFLAIGSGSLSTWLDTYCGRKWMFLYILLTFLVAGIVLTITEPS